MANAGKNTNGSQFFITFDRAPHLDGKHVVFGRCVEGLNQVLRVMERVATGARDKPKSPVVITDCGELGEEVGAGGGEGSGQASSASTAAEDAAEQAEDGEDALNAARSAVLGKDAAEGGRGRAAAAAAAAAAAEEAEEEKARQPPVGMSGRDLRLFQLRQRMNKGRKDNRSATDQEYSRIHDPNFEKKRKRKEYAEQKKEKEQHLEAAGIPLEKAYLIETADVSERRESKVCYYIFQSIFSLCSVYFFR